MKKSMLNRVVTGFFVTSALMLTISCSSKKEVVATEPTVAPAQTEQKVTEVKETTTTTDNLGASSSGRGR